MLDSYAQKKPEEESLMNKTINHRSGEVKNQYFEHLRNTQKDTNDPTDLLEKKKS